VYKIAPVLGPLRNQPPIVGSDEDRTKRNETVKVGTRHTSIKITAIVSS
jgi:hypothetical protein